MPVINNLIILILLVCITTGEVKAAETLVLAGSGTNIAATNLLIASFRKIHPEIAFAPLVNIGSTGAVQAVADGAISLGLLSRQLREEEKKHNLIVIPYAHTPLVIGANRNVVDDGITFADLINVYRGAKTTWKNGKTIVVLTREPGESAIDLLEEKVPDFREVYSDSIKLRRWTVLMKDDHMNKRIIETPDSIGISDMGTILTEKLNIKPLKLNGIAPTSTNVSNGSYPLYKTLAFILRRDRFTPAARAFIEYACSPAGHTILEQNGYASF